jgi:hypothetical protein
MAIAVNTLIDNCEAILQDSTNVRWSAADLIIYLNYGQKEIVRLKPDAYVVKASTQLAAESYQSLPTGGIKLIDIPRYMGTDGTTLGDAIQLIDMKILNNRNPAWHEDTAAAQPTYWMYDQNNPKNFWVYPKNTGTGYVDIVYNGVPTDAAVDGNITLGDEYVVPLTYFILHMAYLRDADASPANADLAIAYQQAFLNSLGLADQKEAEEDPNAQPKESISRS